MVWRRRAARGGVLAIVTSLLLASCSESKPEDGTSATASIGPSGGKMELPGFSLTVPAHALSEPRELTISKTDAPAPAGFTMRSAIYRLEPEGVRFRRPIIVHLDATSELVSGSTIFWSDGFGGYEARPGTRSDGFYVALNTHFSTVFLGEASPSEPDCGRRAERVAFGGPASRIVAGDIDGDGVDDLVAAGPRLSAGFIEVWSGASILRGAPVLLGSQSLSQDPRDIDLVDLDYDGKLDFVITERQAIEIFRSGLVFEARLESSIGDLEAGAVGDGNEDGNYGIYARSAEGVSHAGEYGTADGTYHARPVMSGAMVTGSSWVAADVNADGHDDLDFGSGFLPGRGDDDFDVAVSYMNGFDFRARIAHSIAASEVSDPERGAFGSTAAGVDQTGAGVGARAVGRTTSSAGIDGLSSAARIGALDADADGLFDLFAADCSAGMFRLLRGRGDGEFDGAVVISLPEEICESDTALAMMDDARGFLRDAIGRVTLNMIVEAPDQRPETVNAAWVVSCTGTKEPQRDAGVLDGRVEDAGDGGPDAAGDAGLEDAGGGDAGTPVTFVQQTSPTTEHLYAITWADTRYVVGGRNSVFIESADGLSWSLLATTGVPAGLLIRSLAWSPTLARIVAASSTTNFSTNYVHTLDGSATTWAEALHGSTPFNEIVWAGAPIERFVAATADGLQDSPDGTMWSAIASTSGLYLDHVSWNGTSLIALGSNGTVLTSTDAATWTNRTAQSGTTESFLDLAMGPSTAVAIPLGSPPELIISTNGGASWIAPAWSFAARPQILAWTGASFVGVAPAATYDSADGMTWRENTFSYGAANYAMSGEGPRIVAVGGNGAIAAAE